MLLKHLMRTNIVAFLHTVIAVGLLLVATGCTTSNLQFAGNQLKGFGHFGNAELPEPIVITLSTHAEGLGVKTEIEKGIRDVIDLGGQKRFSEGRVLLEKIRSSVEKDTEGYQAVTASMAILALREGNFPAFMQISGTLDKMLGEPVRVDESYVGIITLYRAVNGNTLPVNAPEKMRRLDGTIQKTASADL